MTRKFESKIFTSSVAPTEPKSTAERSFRGSSYDKFRKLKSNEATSILAIGAGLPTGLVGTAVGLEALPMRSNSTAVVSSLNLRIDKTRS